MRKISFVVVAAALLLSSPAQAFRDISLKQVVTDYGMDNTLLHGYVAGFRDAWANAQIEIVLAQDGPEEIAERVYTCAASMSSLELLRLAVLSNGNEQTTIALQRTLDKLCWALVST